MKTALTQCLQYVTACTVPMSNDDFVANPYESQVQKKSTVIFVLPKFKFN